MRALFWEKMNPKETITLLIVDDQRLIREGIASLLNIQAGLAVVGTAVNGQEAIDKALTLAPDVVLMDVRMPVLDGVTAAARIKKLLPACQILMLTTFDDDEYIVKSIRGNHSRFTNGVAFHQIHLIV